MVLPAQVQQQNDEIDQLYAAVGAKEGAVVTPATEEPDGEPQPDPTPVVALAPVPEGGETPPVVSQTEETFEQRYRTLQGMYNAEIPSLTTSNRELTGRVSQLEGLLAAVSAPPTPDALVPPAPQADVLISEAEVEEYGESIDVMRKAAREEFSPLNARFNALEASIKSLTDTVIPRVEHISNQHKQSAEQRFWSGLADKVPEWQAINNNPDFQTWLLEVDPLTGNTRQVHLEQAQAVLDLDRVAKFFEIWSELSGTPVSQESVESLTPSSKLKSQIAPGRGRAVAASGKQAVTYTPDDLSQFYDDVRTGKYSGREDERNRIERDIFAAQAEGRIINA